jgi:CMP/dCMP kinase
MIITISGYPGSGKSTVAKLLESQLKMKRYSMGDLRREIAQEHNMTIEEWNTHGETSDETDIPVDNKQRDLGKNEDDFIIDGRLSWHFIPNSLKVFLDVAPREGARRILEHSKEGMRPSEGAHESIDEVIKYCADRTASDNKRYQKYYGLKWDNPENFDISIDTSDLTPEQVVEQIIKRVKGS